jgi:hypothetical protein
MYFGEVKLQPYYWPFPYCIEVKALQMFSFETVTANALVSV